jgi:hypothetical protein
MDTLLITLIYLFSNLICQIHYLKSTSREGQGSGGGIN